MRREAVPEGMRRNAFVESELGYSDGEISSECIAVNMVSLQLPRSRIAGEFVGCKEKLPFEFAVCVGVFFAEGKRKFDGRGSFLKVFVM